MFSTFNKKKIIFLFQKLGFFYYTSHLTIFNQQMQFVLYVLWKTEELISFSLMSRLCYGG